MFYRHHAIINGLNDSITALAISARRTETCLAIGCNDGQVAVVDFQSGNILYRQRRTGIAVSSLISLPNDRKAFAAGYEDGRIIIHYAYERYTRRFEANTTGPITALAYDCGRNHLAVACDDRVILTLPAQTDWDELGTFPSPPENVEARDQISRPVSIRFTPDGAHIVIAYLEHGIQICRVGDFTVSRVVAPRTRIGSCDISADARTIVLQNLYDGFDLLDLETDSLQTVKRDTGENVLLPTVFTKDATMSYSIFKYQVRKQH
ncbi:WD40 repeat-like protein [Panus rudis PR-1116 ss-1]|nr:WD40 repeat-like protein [Panus rudis PR-1116 ss-1]